MTSYDQFGDPAWQVQNETTDHFVRLQKSQFRAGVNWTKATVQVGKLKYSNQLFRGELFVPGSPVEVKQSFAGLPPELHQPAPSIGDGVTGRFRAVRHTAYHTCTTNSGLVYVQYQWFVNHFDNQSAMEVDDQVAVTATELHGGRPVTVYYETVRLQPVSS